MGEQRFIEFHSGNALKFEKEDEEAQGIEGESLYWHVTIR
jgi:hypothetical protein